MISSFTKFWGRYGSGARLNVRYQLPSGGKNSNIRKMCQDVGISLLGYTRGKHKQPSIATKQKEYTRRLTRRGNYNVLAHFPSIRVFTVGFPNQI